MKLFRLWRRKPLSQSDGNASSYADDIRAETFQNEQTERRGGFSSLSNTKQHEKHSPEDVELHNTVASLIDDVATAEETSGDKASRALRKLFALSEQTKFSSRVPGDPRIAMVRVANARLIPVLISFLGRCQAERNRGNKKAAEYLALLLLNNISIPMENKRLIALDYDGAKVLCQLLLQDLSCQMAAIILTNLTLANTALRIDLVAAETTSSKVYLIPTLAFALRASSLTRKELDSVTEMMMCNMTVQERLSALLSNRNDDNYVSIERQIIPSIREQSYPDTARWCLSVLQNLTRPANGSNLAAHSVIRYGIVPHILRFIIVQFDSKETVQDSKYENNADSFANSPTTADPSFSYSILASSMTRDSVVNPPSRWSSQSAPDAALFTIMNVASVSSTIDYLLYETQTIEVMLNIIRFYYKSKYRRSSMILNREDNIKLARFQCLKARMTLAYLLGSYGHFGQRKRARMETTKVASFSKLINGSVLVIKSETEGQCLIELVGNALHERPKSGPGGYLSIMFNIKCVLFALRCLLTQYKNQTFFGETQSVRKLNTILLKVMAMYSLRPRWTFIDSDCAESACFSLYLLSNSGFRNPFLPSFLGNDDDIAESIAAKVLFSYVQMCTKASAGKHAATQLLLRLKYLIFTGSIDDIDDPIPTEPTDFIFDQDLLEHIQETIVPIELTRGTEPLFDIFERPIFGLWEQPLQVNPQKTNSYMHHHLRAIESWDSHVTTTSHTTTLAGTGRSYPNALIAVQTLSYGSTKYKHSANELIDDIKIANTIAACADAVDIVNSSQSYSHTWRWYDSYEILFQDETGSELTSPSSSDRLGDCNAWASVWNIPCRSMFLTICGKNDSH